MWYILVKGGRKDETENHDISFQDDFGACGDGRVARCLLGSSGIWMSGGPAQPYGDASLAMYDFYLGHSIPLFPNPVCCVENLQLCFAGGVFYQSNRRLFSICPAVGTDRISDLSVSGDDTVYDGRVDLVSWHLRAVCAEFLVLWEPVLVMQAHRKMVSPHRS